MQSSRVQISFLIVVSSEKYWIFYEIFDSEIYIEYVKQSRKFSEENIYCQNFFVMVFKQKVKVILFIKLGFDEFCVIFNI